LRIIPDKQNLLDAGGEFVPKKELKLPHSYNMKGVGRGVATRKFRMEKKKKGLGKASKKEKMQWGGRGEGEGQEGVTNGQPETQPCNCLSYAKWRQRKRTQIKITRTENEEGKRVDTARSPGGEDDGRDLEHLGTGRMKRS